MARKKILHIVEDLRIGGLEKVIASIVMGLDKNKFETEVWCLARGGEIAEELIGKGFPVRVLGMKSYYNPTQIMALSKLIRRSHIDLIHAHGYFASTFGRLAAILARTPVVIAHVHTTFYGFRKRNLLIERSLSYFTDKIVCVSLAVKDFVVEIEGISEKKTCLIYNGVGQPGLFECDTDSDVDRKSLGLGQDDIIVITVASLTPHKGHGVLIDATRIALKRHKHIRLLIVGDGPLRNRLKTYAIKSGFSSTVVFAGQRNDIYHLLGLSDIFVLPSILREGLPVSIAEALAMSKPVIGSNLGGIPEVIEDEINGLLVTPGNPYELATAIDRLAIDSSMRTRMGMNGRKIYEEKFTAQKMIEHIESLYDELLRKRFG